MRQRHWHWSNTAGWQADRSTESPEPAGTAIGLVGGLCGSSLGAQVIELRILVIAIVGTIAISSGGSVIGHQVVFGGRIIRLPAATECALTLRSDTADGNR